jgi:hypothetical protein
MALICFSVLALVQRAAPLRAFTGASNWGGTGLLGGVIKEKYRFGASQVHPYRVYYIGGGIDRLEVNGG